MKSNPIIDRLEDDIRDYRVEFQRFLNGDTQIPPERIEQRIRKSLNALLGDRRLTAVDRYRIGGLESRYNSLMELFRRRQREMQLGSRTPAQTPAPERLVVDLDGDSGGERLESLYRAIYGGSESGIRFEDFSSYLRAQADKVRERAGCDKVRFTVRKEDGRPKLKVRPLADPQPRDLP